MKSNQIYVGLVIFLILIAGAVIFFFTNHDLNSGLSFSQADQNEGKDITNDKQNARALLTKIESLEARISQLESQQAVTKAVLSSRPTDNTFPAHDSGSNSDSTPAEIPSATLLTNEDNEIFSEALLSEETKKAIQEFMRKEEDTKDKEQEKPEKKISEIAEELNLNYVQEQKLEELNNEMADELMTILFDVKDDFGLEDLKRKFQEVEYNPELKEELREKLLLNSVNSQGTIMVAMLKIWSNGTEFLTAEQLEELGKYKLLSDNAEWPNLGNLLFGK